MRITALQSKGLPAHPGCLEVLIKMEEHFKQPCGWQLGCLGMRALESHRSQFKSWLHQGGLVILIWFLSEPQFQQLLSGDTNHPLLGAGRLVRIWGDKEGQVPSRTPGTSQQDCSVFFCYHFASALPAFVCGEAGRREGTRKGHLQQRNLQEKMPRGLDRHAGGVGLLGHKGGGCLGRTWAPRFPWWPLPDPSRWLPLNPAAVSWVS